MEDVLTLSESNTAWMEKEVMNGFRLWHLMFISTSIFLFVGKSINTYQSESANK